MLVLTAHLHLFRTVGKTTFTKLITGELEADSGFIELGETVVLGVYDQLGLKFDATAESQTVLEFVIDQVQANDSTSVGDTPAEARKLLKQFEFQRSRWNEQISVLSGGERRRLQLLSVLSKVCLGFNLLVLVSVCFSLIVLLFVDALQETECPYPG